MADDAKTVPTDGDGWVYLEHEDTGGTTRIPNEDGVRVWHEARGWRVVDPPTGAAPFVPDADGGQALPAAAADAIEGAEVDPQTGASWVELVHPLDGAVEPARQRVPANAEAVAGALEAGWVLPRKTDGDVPKPAKRAARKRAAAEQAAGPAPAAQESDAAPAAPAQDDKAAQAAEQEG